MLTLPPRAALLALILTAAPLSASASEAYTVQKGDSLSSIAARMLGDADRWREIWSLNPRIRTPKQLQPGTRLRLPAAAAENSPLAGETTSPGAVLDPVPVLAQEVIRSGHIDRMRTDYRLLDTDSAESRTRIHSVRSEADGNYLYVHGLSGSATEGTLYGLFKPSPEPAGNSFVELTRIGQAELVRRQAGKGRLRITENRLESLMNVQLLPMRVASPKIRAEYPATPVNARIIKALYEQPGGYLLLLDRGRQSGIKLGQLLSYSKPGSAESGSDHAMHPPGGWMLVIDTSRDASLALVLQARQIPAVGDRVN